VHSTALLSPTFAMIMGPSFGRKTTVAVLPLISSSSSRRNPSFTRRNPSSIEPSAIESNRFAATYLAARLPLCPSNTP